MCRSSATPSWPVLLFALGVSVLTGVIFGIAPAWMTSHADPVEALRGANRSVGGRRSWAQKSLVIAQAAMSLVLLSAAALLAPEPAQPGAPGFRLRDRRAGISRGSIRCWATTSRNRWSRCSGRSTTGCGRFPECGWSRPALYAPMTGDSWNNGVRIEGRPEPGAKEDTGAGWARVMPGFFETIGAKIVLGRPITEEDTAATRKVAVVNEAFAKRFFKGQNPIGQHFGPDKIKYSLDLRDRRSRAETCGT